MKTKYYEQPKVSRARLDAINAGYAARTELSLKRTQLDQLRQKLSRPQRQEQPPQSDLDRARETLARLQR